MLFLNVTRWFRIEMSRQPADIMFVYTWRFCGGKRCLCSSWSGPLAMEGRSSIWVDEGDTLFLCMGRWTIVESRTKDPWLDEYASVSLSVTGLYVSNAYTPAFCVDVLLSNSLHYILLNKIYFCLPY